MAATPEVYERTPVKATADFSGMATQHACLHIVSLAHSTVPVQLDARCQLALNRHYTVAMHGSFSELCSSP